MSTWMVIKGQMIIAFAAFIVSIIMYIIGDPRAIYIFIVGTAFSAFSRGYWIAYKRERNRVLRKAIRIMRGSREMEHAIREFEEAMGVKHDNSG